MYNSSFVEVADCMQNFLDYLGCLSLWNAATTDDLIKEFTTGYSI